MFFVFLICIQPIMVEIISNWWRLPDGSAGKKNPQETQASGSLGRET